MTLCHHLAWKSKKTMHTRTRFHDCFNVYKILICKEIQQHFQKESFASSVSDIFFNFHFMNFMKIFHILKSNTWRCVLHVATITLFWLVTFIHTYTYTHAHTHTLPILIVGGVELMEEYRFGIDWRGVVNKPGAEGV